MYSAYGKPAKLFGTTRTRGVTVVRCWELFWFEGLGCELDHLAEQHCNHELVQKCSTFILRTLALNGTAIAATASLFDATGVLKRRCTLQPYSKDSLCLPCALTGTSKSSNPKFMIPALQHPKHVKRKLAPYSLYSKPLNTLNP